MRRSLTFILLAGAATLASAQQQQPPRGPSTTDPTLAAREAALREAADKLPDAAGSGPYKAIKEVDPTLANHVVYRPATLPTDRKLGVIVWGNGGCREDGASARQHLGELASHGYVVIAPGEILSGPGAPPKQPEKQGLFVQTTTADVLAGLDWALAENKRQGSRYFGRIDPAQVGVAGHSCGGLQAIQAAADPRIKAVIVHNSGVFKDGGNPIRGMVIDKSALLKIHTPVLYVLGGPSDVAYPNGTDDFRKIAHVPAMLLNLNVGHGGTFREPSGGTVAQVSAKWFDWQLRGDKAAAKTFTGPDCGVCTDPKWMVERKGIS
jgi:dienelactone hydrolase